MGLIHVMGKPPRTSMLGQPVIASRLRGKRFMCKHWPTCFLLPVGRQAQVCGVAKQSPYREMAA